MHLKPPPGAVRFRSLMGCTSWALSGGVDEETRGKRRHGTREMMGNEVLIMGESALGEY